MATPIRITSDFATVTPGQAVNITWTSGDKVTPLTIAIRRDTTKTVTILTNAAKNETYTWTPDISLIQTASYALEIQQGDARDSAGPFLVTTAAAITPTSSLTRSSSASGTATGTSADAAATSTVTVIEEAVGPHATFSLSDPNDLAIVVAVPLGVIALAFVLYLFFRRWQRRRQPRSPPFITSPLPPHLPALPFSARYSRSRASSRSRFTTRPPPEKYPEPALPIAAAYTRLRAQELDAIRSRVAELDGRSMSEMDGSAHSRLGGVRVKEREMF
ncbi:MAG: hypothetical protein M1832_002041 [Thelocarpon impressellum]|nr:MAG: hypothetical protein M1832_002041 [Thelocarpon impressellum]